MIYLKGPAFLPDGAFCFLSDIISLSLKTRCLSYALFAMKYDGGNQYNEISSDNIKSLHMTRRVSMAHVKKLTLLHSNDLHGDLLAEDIDHKLVGGVSMLSGYINKVRNESPNTLYCISGDMFRGSVIDSEYKGLSTIEIMNLLAPDVVTIGNHETDYGVAHLLFIEKLAKFPIINANMFIKTNHTRLFQPYKIVEIGGMKILFIGILTEEVLAQTKNDGLVGTFVNVEEAAAEVGKICNTYNAIDIDFTVLLTHIGWDEDQELAKRLDPAWGVDVIIGGHSHTLPEQPVSVNGVLIVQAGVGTDQIGRFDLEIDTDKNCVHSWKWKTIPINEKTCPRDPDLENIIKGYKNVTDQKYGRVITRLTHEHTHPSRTQETEIGDLYADILKESLGLDIFLMGSGSIRTPKFGPIVTYGDLVENFPYNGPCYMMTVTGSQLKRMLIHMCRDEVWRGAHCEFYQLSEGLHVVYSKSKHDFTEFDFNGEPIGDNQKFTLGLQKFHFMNFESIFNVSMAEVEKNGSVRAIATSDQEILDEYMSSHQHLGRKVSCRLIIND